MLQLIFKIGSPIQKISSLISERFYFLFLICLSPTVFALSPQQYCEALQKKSPGLFELLNLETSGGEVSFRKSTVSEVSNVESDSPVHHVNHEIEITGCGNLYKITLGGSSSLKLQTNQVKVELVQGSGLYPVCASNGIGTICSGAACVGGSRNSEVNLSAFQISLPALESGCVNRQGAMFKNGNSCIVSDIKLTQNITYKTVVYEGESTQVPQYGIKASLNESSTDSASQIKVKYCAAGMFSFATVRTGPYNQPNDSIVTCIRANGQSLPQPFATKPVQGELVSDLKYWLVDKNGCSK